MARKEPKLKFKCEDDLDHTDYIRSRRAAAAEGGSMSSLS